MGGRARRGRGCVFIRHTSASILIQENADPNVQRDLEIFIAKLVEDPHAYRNLSDFETPTVSIY